MENNFLPNDYIAPDNSNYMKFKEGENTFRVLSSAITGYEYWTTENKPVRSKTPFKTTPNIKTNKDGSKSIKHFWAFVVYNQDSKKIQILEVDKSSIQKKMLNIINNKKWGDPKNYDFVVIKTGSGFDTEYDTMSNPHSPISEDIIKEYQAMNIKLEELYTSGDPFRTNTETVHVDDYLEKVVRSMDEQIEEQIIDVSNIPFGN
jgi:hypothetical protein